jgi:plasmid segregation protein ParM
MANIIGLDIGRSGVKVYTGTSMFTFPSIVGEGKSRNLRTDYGDGSFEVLFDGESYFVGDLAQHESDYWRAMLTDDKANRDALILALTAIARAKLTDVTIVTGLPVAQHNEENKQRMRDLFHGKRGGIWDLTVNGERKLIRIVDVKVAVEGGGAFWSAPQDGLVRIIDAGSKTINFVTMRDTRYNNRESGSLDFGFSTVSSDNPRQMANRIAGSLGGRNWKAEDTVLVCGGRARELADLLSAEFFPRAIPMNNPLYANAIGFYHAGRNTQ